MLRTLVITIAVSSVAVLPVVLVGALAVLLQEDLAFSDAQLGTAVAAYFASGALVSPFAGRLAERVGPRTTARLGLASVIGSLLGIALVADSWALLVVFLGMGGIGSTLTQLSASVLLIRSIPARRQGIAFGVKQAAIPLAAVLAGLSVPAIGLTLGWRWAFLLSAMIATLAGAMPARDPARPGDGRSPARDTSLGVQVLLALGLSLASAGSNSCMAFIVASSVERGFSLADAGLVLAGGSFVALTVRVLAGWVADRLGRGSLLFVAVLVAVGGVGYVGLAFAEEPALTVCFAALAFGGGSGWGGLWQLAVSRANPAAPGSAMGIVFIGGMIGGMIGPLLFGALAEYVGFLASWLLMAAAAILAMGAILLSRRRILREGTSLPR